MNHLMQNLKLLTAVLGMVFIATWHVSADSVVLRQHAEVEGEQVTLGDVAIVEGKVAKQLAELVVAELSNSETSRSITLETVREVLNREKVNWGLMSLRGFDTCHVRKAVVEETLTVADDISPVVSNSVRELDVAGPLTVGEKIVDAIVRRSGFSRLELQIQFHQRYEELLSESLVTGRWVVEPLTTGPLGRVSVVVRELLDDGTSSAHRLYADVARKVTAVVAVRDIRQNQTIAPGDVELRSILIDQSHFEPVVELNEIVGKVCASTLRADQPIGLDRLRSPWLVRRGETVTVRCISGALEVKVNARAQQDGSQDELIEMKNTRTREVFLARVTKRGQAVMIIDETGGKNKSFGGQS